MENAARKAFEAYYGARASAYGSTQERMYEENRNWPSFLEIGKVCLSHGWDPAEYASEVFSSLSSCGGLVLPSNLVTKAAVAYFDKRKRDSGFDPKEVWNVAESTVTELVVDGPTEKQVLMNPMLMLPAWFRVFYPEELDSDIVAVYGSTARDEMTPEIVAFVGAKNKRSLDTFLGLWQSSKPPTAEDQPC